MIPSTEVANLRWIMVFSVDFEMLIFKVFWIGTEHELAYPNPANSTCNRTLCFRKWWFTYLIPSSVWGVHVWRIHFTKPKISWNGCILEKKNVWNPIHFICELSWVNLEAFVTFTNFTSFFREFPLEITWNNKQFPKNTPITPDKKPHLSSTLVASSSLHKKRFDS